MHVLNNIHGRHRYKSTHAALCMLIRNDPLPTTECMPARASIETILYHTDLFLTPAVIFSYWGCGKSFIYYMHACTQ